MRLDQLQLDLRPRSNAQALDLGFALLRANAGRAYAVWLSLWVPAMLISTVLAHWFFDSIENQISYSFVLAWWLRPYLERAPLYVLSRQVFGEQVGYMETLKAWPKQLGGGFFRLFILRPFAAGRGLYQAIWLLEGARGKTARYRIRIVGRHTTGSATWFGLACAHFEAILQFGFYALVSFLISDNEFLNPFALIVSTGTQEPHLLIVCTFLGFTIAGGLIGPIYTACCFTLYLNRRATLEAWDLEIALRQIATASHRPDQSSAARSSPAVSTLMAFAVVALLGGLGINSPAKANEVVDNTLPTCEKEKLIEHHKIVRAPTADLETQQTRKTLDDIYASDDLKFLKCEERWLPKIDKKKPKEEASEISDRMKLIASILKYFVIAVGLVFLIWLIIRYSGQFFSTTSDQKLLAAIEVAGLDIRPESLPDDVTNSALDLWRQGQQRAAIGLLYRASIARLVSQYALYIAKGATEQDCLRLVTRLQANDVISVDLQNCFSNCTETWLRAAYAHQYPDSIETLCAQWSRSFEQGAPT